MNSLTRQYLFGAIFIAVGIYQALQYHFLECSLYVIAGMAFVANALSLQPQFVAYRRLLGVVSWILIIIAVVLFLYVLTHKF